MTKDDFKSKKEFKYGDHLLWKEGSTYKDNILYGVNATWNYFDTNLIHNDIGSISFTNYEKFYLKISKRPVDNVTIIASKIMMFSGY